MPTTKKRKRAMGAAVAKPEGKALAYDADKRFARYMKVCKQIRGWETRQSRAQAKLDKLRKTRSYYQKMGLDG